MTPREHQSIAERFWSKTTATPMNGCILWSGAKTGRHKDRGYFAIHRKPRLSHRVIYELALGAIPDGKVLMHICDNGLCMKLQHLDVGTQKQNIQDASNKGRLIGNRTHFRPLRKVTQDDIAAICAKRASGVKVTALMAEYGLSMGHVYKILDDAKRRK